MQGGQGLHQHAPHYGGNSVPQFGGGSGPFGGGGGSGPFGGKLEPGGQPRFGGCGLPDSNSSGGGLLSSLNTHHPAVVQDLMPKFDFSHCVVPKFEPKFEVSSTRLLTLFYTPRG
jgi:hypothetical protein